MISKLRLALAPLILISSISGLEFDRNNMDQVSIDSAFDSNMGCAQCILTGNHFQYSATRIKFRNSEAVEKEK